MKSLAENGAAPPTKRLPRTSETSLRNGSARTLRLEQALDQIREQLESYLELEDERLRDRKLSSLAEFAAGAAHEINTPLAIISGQAQQLLKNEAAPERRRSLEQIVTQAQRVHVLFRDLMTYARPPQPVLESLDLNKLIAKAIRQVKELAERRQVRLKRRNQARAILVLGDAKMLESAVVSLLRNAIEAAPPEGWARIEAGKGVEGTIVIAVEDNGPGLTKVQREHLFDPFFSGRSAGRGVGLGLSKIWRIAQLHGGDIQVEASPNEPTRFELTLPAATRRRPAPASTNGQLNGVHPPTPRSVKRR